ncbi:MAG: carboxypeptidase regulatory-like domain-containing protein, partial [Myxococcota bacterium]
MAFRRLSLAALALVGVLLAYFIWVSKNDNPVATPTNRPPLDAPRNKASSASTKVAPSLEPRGRPVSKDAAGPDEARFAASPPNAVTTPTPARAPESEEAAAPAQATGRIAGQVLDAEDRPVVGAKVYTPNLFRPTSAATTGTDGHFAIEGLDKSVGPLTVTATYRDRVGSASRVAIDTQNLILRLQTQGGFLTGRVSKPDGEPAGVFTVQLLQQVGRLETRPMLSQTFVHPEGEYKIGPLLPRAYRVRATDNIGAASVDQNIEVTEGNAAVVDLRLRVGASVSGVVLAADTRAPIPGAIVRMEAAFYGGRQSTCGPDGQFTITGLAPGLFSLSGAADGFHRRNVSGLRAVDGQPTGPVEILLTPLQSPDEQPKTELAGIGAALGVDKDSLIVRGVLDGGGAAEAGLQTGDIILSIAGRSMAEMDFNTAIQLIRGPEGSTVLLEV